jgi:hypothetical protein
VSDREKALGKCGHVGRIGDAEQVKKIKRGGAAKDGGRDGRVFACAKGKSVTGGTHICYKPPVPHIVPVQVPTRTIIAAPVSTVVVAVIVIVIIVVAVVVVSAIIAAVVVAVANAVDWAWETEQGASAAPRLRLVVGILDP